MNRISRRRFLKIAGFGAGAAAVAAGTGGGLQAMARKPAAGETRVVPTFCDICFWKCNALAHVRDGRLWKITGNPDDPLSRGRLCPRGTGGIGAHFDPDRLRAPLMRHTRPRRGSVGRGHLGRGARLHRRPHAEDQGRSTAPRRWRSSATASAATFLKHTLKAYGSPNIAAPSFAQCRGPRDVGFELTFGEGIGSPERTDIANARCLVLIGSHLGENMHNTQVQEFADAVAAGAAIIVADPRFSIAASKAQHYLPVKPGTDLALLLAWMNVIVTEGLYDREYVEQHGFGFEHFKAEIATRTPEWAYPETGIAPDTIRETAREMARHRPATLVHPGRRTTWYGDDAQRSRAIALLNALLGSWGRKGGFYYPVEHGRAELPLPALPAVGSAARSTTRTTAIRSRARRSRRASARRR